jgi:hypothetical protein
LLPNHSKHNYGAENKVRKKQKNEVGLPVKEKLLRTRVSRDGHRSENFPEQAKPQAKWKRDSTENQKKKFRKKKKKR